jgi:AcrR family transcriptional regulator
VTVELGLRERKKLRTRQLIADTARRLFLERGFDRVTVAEIARTADVSEATVFNYFRTKEDLVFSGLEQFEAELLDSVRHREVGESALAAFARFILRPRGLLAEGDDARAADLLNITRLIATTPELLAAEQQIFATYTESLAGVLIEETGATVRDVRPHVAATAMIGVHQALIHFVRQRLLAGATDRKRLAREMTAVGRAAFAMLTDGFGSYALATPRSRRKSAS